MEAKISRPYSNFDIATILPQLGQDTTSPTITSEPSSPVPSASSSVSSSMSPPSAIRDHSSDYQAIIARYYYDTTAARVQEYLRRCHLLEAERARLQPPSWTQRQQPQQQQFPSCLIGTISPQGRRRRYTEAQTCALQRTYAECKYVTREEMLRLAGKIGLTALQVKIWFQNKRLKDRKRCREEGEEFPEPPPKSSS